MSENIKATLAFAKQFQSSFYRRENITFYDLNALLYHPKNYFIKYLFNSFLINPIHRAQKYCEIGMYQFQYVSGKSQNVNLALIHTQQ